MQCSLHYYACFGVLMKPAVLRGHGFPPSHVRLILITVVNFNSSPCLSECNMLMILLVCCYILGNSNNGIFGSLTIEGY